MTLLDDRHEPNDLSDLVHAAVSRRSLLTGGVAAAVGAFLLHGNTAGPLRALGAAPAAAAHAHRTTRFGFTPIEASTADAVAVPPEYEYQVLYRWGDPVRGEGPKFRFDASNSADEQAQQAGMGHDGMHFFPLAPTARGRERGLLVMNHEFAESFLLFADGDSSSTPERVRKSQNAHGVSVVEVENVDGRWEVVASGFSRRITANTPMALAGPAARHPLMRTNGDAAGTRVLGTVNNCASGQTPWGTYLTCEENFNGYFGTATPATVTTDMAAYGITPDGNGLGWWRQDRRFDVAAEPNEPNRFGWIVEIDPFRKNAVPTKRTALGRFKHENAFVSETADGRVVVYSGDDERGQFVYKFVGARPWRDVVAEGESPLDDGTLYVARFDDDATAGDGRGVGTWLPLVHGNGPLVAPAFPDQASVLVRARQAAAALGATRMDRPEWITADPSTGDVYCTMTNNSRRGTTAQPVDEANPRPRNPWGHIIRWTETGGDHGATTFAWDLFVLAGDPANPAHGTTGDLDAFGSPDGLGFDRFGRLWIQTDGAQPVACNNQMLVADPATKEVRRFLVGPKGCEITGLAFTPDNRTLFVNVQHPGEAGTATEPRAQSNWPDFRPDGRPRDATVVIRRRDGGVVGS
ncbi:MAG TPA: PhoX family phosphatase [Acidimicrobiales bacterium]|nr:PhoX family phosphatase [Acidimicrobiales bacterium]